MRTKEIRELNQIINKRKVTGKTSADFKKEMMMNMVNADTKMKETTMSDDSDRDFASMMKMHHTMGIDMANIYLKWATDEKLITMTKQGIKDQKKDITDLENWMVKR